MKKVLCILITVSLLAGLCACNVAKDFVRDNAPKNIADAFDQAIDQGSELMESAADKLKERFADRLGDVSEDARKAIGEKIDQLPEVDQNTTIFTTIPNKDGNGVAILANFPNARLAATLTEFPIGTKFPDPANESSKTFTLEIDGRTVKMSSMQCQAYARYIQEKLYADHDLKDGSNPNFTNILPETIGSATVAEGKLTADMLKKAISSAGPGAHLRTAGKKHSMVIVEIAETGFVVLQANADGNMTIEQTAYTWDTFVNDSFGSRGLTFINVYRPVN